ncbi:hypothetical protein DACRYDRAFT_113241 [Dacryopinax primogenitus]|uniref:Transcription initiation factor IIF subunit alpha n=1 Tax=Dacryopinax primogenitus (strain DJM 731) TaxID=1858805 RepID=M5G8M7_DACPD|nr:uncharacterized protein DACRYDRAFT_113241 [Dacryopinax primogenitus]EJU06571.1 hypothetical protein DACRYDRAFT_113241 [Dacryopinax primogenitus]
MASRIKTELKNEPMEFRPLGRRAQPNRPPPPRPPPLRPGQSKAFVQPDVKPKVEMKPLPEDPPGTYSDFVITSTGISEWRHDMMSFRPTSVKSAVNPMEWPRPVKLNRKELKKNYKTVDKVEPAKPLLGLDGKPVIGPDGKVVMVGGVDGLQPNGRPRPKDNGKGKDKDQQKRKFKRTKTRQVFRVSDEVRQLRREERHPWVLESGDGQQLWEGRMEDRGPPLQVLLFENNKGPGGFLAVPLNKWYTFKEPPKHTILTLDQAEQFEKDIAKNSDIQRWMMRRTGGKVSDATQMTLKRESSAEPTRPRTTSDGSVLSRSGMRVLQVRTGNTADYNNTGDDDEGDEGAAAARRRRDRGGGGDGDYDEFEFEEEFADDDEGAIFPEDEEEDEETKALKEKEARMMRAANVTNDENRMDETAQDEEEESDEDELNDAGKAMKKALRLWEKGAYADDDDDDNKNPYLSSDEEEEEQEGTDSGTNTPLPTGVLPQPGTPPKPTTNAKPNGSASKPGFRPLSRATSPVPGKPATNGISGAHLLAQRATSPPPGTNRVPPAGTPQRALSPLAAEAGGKRAGSPPRTSPVSGSLKRKAPDEGSSPPSGRASSPGGTATSPGPSTTPNKRPRTLPKVTVPANLQFDKAIPPGPIIAFLRIKPRTTGDCVKNFKDWFKEDGRNKGVLSFWIKQIARLDNSGGEAVLKLHDDAKLAQMGIEF